jgi:predicted ester cyclase
MSSTAPGFRSTAEDDASLALMRRMLDEGFAGGDVSVVDELCSPELVEHQFGLSGTGSAAIEHVKAAMRDVHQSFPDLTFEVQDVVHQGDTIWLRSRGRATASGEFFGPPTGRPVEFTVIDVARVAGGRIVEHWGVPDRFALLAQTGLLARLSA